MITTIIVSHNSSSYLQRAVESSLRYTFATLVVDNASTDHPTEQIPVDPRITFLANTENRGFAAAVNQAAALASTPFLLLLNPDAELLTPLDPLLTRIGENRHTAAAGLLVDESRSPQKGFTVRRLPTPTSLAFEVLGINRIWPANPVNRRYRCLDMDLNQVQMVEQPAGAFLLFRRDDWAELGGFDEQFHPVWFEDVDFCARLLAVGGKIWFDPAAQAKHFGGHSVQKIDVTSRIRFWYGSLLKYAAKHFAPVARRMVALAVMIVLPPRAFVGMFRDTSSTAISSHLFIWQSAWRCFWSGTAVSKSPGTES